MSIRARYWGRTILSLVAISLGWPVDGALAHPLFETASVVNSAGFMPAELPGGAIARGGMFSIFGVALGPPEGRAADGFPLPTTLAGVTVTVSAQGGAARPVVLLFVNRQQINAIMPSDAPLGAVTLRVSFDDGDGSPLSLPVTVRVVEASFGIFTVNVSKDGPAVAQNFVSEAEQPLNSPSNTAQPGQYVTLWGSGLGAAQGSDTLPPGEQGGVFDRSQALNLQVLIGGAPSADVLYAGRSPQFAGLDQIVFRIPENAPLGCYTPVAVRLGSGLVSNFATLAIGAAGGRCEDPMNPYWSAPGDAPAIGSLLLSRLFLPTASGSSVSDAGVGLLGKPSSRNLYFSPALSMPPLGSCTSYAERNVAGGLDTRALAVPLDAGQALSIRGPRGQRDAPVVAPGTYQASLAFSNTLPAFLEAGDYTVQSSGGGDVGSFQASAYLPDPPQWQIVGGRILTRSQPVEVAWTPSGRDDEYVWILGVMADSGSLTQNVTTTFLCVARDADGTMAIPPEILANAPPSLGSGDITTATLWLGWRSLPGANRFEASGLDYGFLDTLAARGIPVEVR